MLVTFVSQCEKKALKRTRRILDAFANRIGDNVWQTAITEDGLAMVKQLLRASATKSTAVSCHRVRTRRKTELVWIVGNKRKFNEVGIVPVNWTRQSLLHGEWEREWLSLESIQIIATLSALLHDIGKSTKGFQHKLFHQTTKGDPYRHEWISLQLFIWLIEDCETDEDWLDRLQNLPNYLSSATPNIQPKPILTKLNQLPPLAGWVAWLIVTHHRLPPLTDYHFKPKVAEKLKTTNNKKLNISLCKYYSYIQPLNYWVCNPLSIEDMSENEQAQFWQFEELVLYSPVWQSKIVRWARKAIAHPQLNQLSQQANKDKQAISNPFLLYLSRLCLMVGDHNYSSLDEDSKRRVYGSKEFKDKLAANTNRQTNEIKQALDEHLIGVGAFTAQFCRALPALHKELPKLTGHDYLVKNTAGKRFKWQNKAFKTAYENHELSETHGFFGINMASTGAGKTIGNARIMYGLADPSKGARITVALGLRVLTLQTGLSFREDLKLNREQLAILVGGTAQKQLFEMNQNKNPDTPTSDNVDVLSNLAQNQIQYEKAYGSESANELIDEWLDYDPSNDWSIGDYEELGLGTVIEDKKARDLIFSPFVVCTVDHIIQASECKRGGKHIAPILRLFSSDLILDEPDDFDHNDLPALSRLVHLAGLFGSRVMLSSATLSPDMVQGLFEAYLEGRKIYNTQMSKPTPNVLCGWFDENDCVITPCLDSKNFQKYHSSFADKRCDFLAKQPIRRKADILPFDTTYHKEKHHSFYHDFSSALLNQAYQLHLLHHITSEDKQHCISIGLIRMANIQPLMHTAIAMFNHSSTPHQDTTQYHICCYHSNQVVVLRNRLERKLDAILNRKKGDEHDIINNKYLKQAIRKHSNKKHHVFIVLATAVAEVGRDHDYDWAIVEPSSMRSIIQLAGRVWRHRPEKEAVNTNISLLQFNIKSLKQPNRGIGKAVFTRPGFEQPEHLLNKHDSHGVIRAKELNRIDAVARIKKVADEDFDATNYLSDLEHSVMSNLMNNEKINVVNGYWRDAHTSNRSHVHLSCLTPFRNSTKQVDYIIEPTVFKSILDKNNITYDSYPDTQLTPQADGTNTYVDAIDEFNIYILEQIKSKGFKEASSVKKNMTPTILPITNPHISPWLDDNLTDALLEVQKEYPELSANTILMRFAVLTVYDYQDSWFFDERFGCWQNEGRFMDENKQ